MSLDFDVSKIEDHANVTTAPHNGFNDKPQWHPVTSGLVWASIPCGFSGITEQNLDLVWRRVSLWQAVIGAFQSGPEGDVPTTKEDLRRHIGLRTNASGKTEKEFMETLHKQIERNNEKATPAMDIIGWKGRPGNVRSA